MKSVTPPRVESEPKSMVCGKFQVISITFYPEIHETADQVEVQSQRTKTYFHLQIFQELVFVRGHSISDYIFRFKIPTFLKLK